MFGMRNVGPLMKMAQRQKPKLTEALVEWWCCSPDHQDLLMGPVCRKVKKMALVRRSGWLTDFQALFLGPGHEK